MFYTPNEEAWGCCLPHPPPNTSLTHASEEVSARPRCQSQATKLEGRHRGIPEGHREVSRNHLSEC